MPALELHEVTVRYSGCDAPALQIPHLRIAQGETVAITGPSGSGKTTLISILCGLEQPATGTIRWDDVNLNLLPETRKDRWRARHIGLVMQDFHLHPGLGARENVLLPAHFRHWRVPGELKRRADELLERVGIRTGSRPVGKFSRGEMQRVAVARAMLMSPPCWSPTSRRPVSIRGTAKTLPACFWIWRASSPSHCWP